MMEPQNMLPTVCDSVFIAIVLLLLCVAVVIVISRSSIFLHILKKGYRFICEY